MRYVALLNVDPSGGSYTVSSLTGDRLAIGHKLVEAAMKKWLQIHFDHRPTSPSSPIVEKECCLSEMGSNSLVVSKQQRVDLAITLVIRKKELVVLFEVQSNKNREETIIKLSCALMHQLIYLRNRGVSILEVVGFYIPVVEGFVEKLTCSWSDVVIQFRSAAQKLNSSDIWSTIEEVYEKQSHYKPSFDSSEFTIPMSLEYIQSNFGEKAFQMQSTASVVICDPEIKKVYKYCFGSPEKDANSSLVDSKLDLRYSNLPTNQQFVNRKPFFIFDQLDKPLSKDLAKTCLNKFVRGCVNALKELHDSNIAHLDVRLENVCIDPETKEPVLIDLDRSEEITEKQIAFCYGGSTMCSPGTSDIWTTKNSDWRQLAIMIIFIQSTKVKDYHTITVDDSAHSFLKTMFNEGNS